jgi:Zn-dependent protease/CBS domain-containing protein
VFWSLAASMFPSTFPGQPTWVYYVMSAVATVLFFASILVHEISHTLQSLREGVQVRDITLWLFGGVSRTDGQMPGPGAEFRVVAAGPLASGFLALLFWGLAVASRAWGLSETVVGVATYLAAINGLLLAFNVVPALPLDGGRLLHALLWKVSGNSGRSTVHAAWAGQGFAILLVIAGAYLLVRQNSTSGLWFLLLGWFIGQAARQEGSAGKVSAALSGRRVRDLMARVPVTVHPEMTVDDVANLLVGVSHPVYPVVDDGRFVGLLWLRDAGRVPLDERAAVRVRDVMRPAAEVPVVHPDDLIEDVVPLLGHEPGRVVVSDPLGQVVGILSDTDLTRAVTNRSRIWPAPDRPSRWRP